MKKNNRGSAFVMVLVILGIVGILAAVCLWLSLVSYQMKLTDVKVKNNFYSAESVLDQICVGLQGDVSEAYQKAYNKIIVNYPEMNDAQRQSVFDSQFKRELTERLRTPGSTDWTYNLTKLKEYVYEELRNGTGTAKAEIAAVYNDASNDTMGKLVPYDDCIVLEAIEVTYTDKENFSTIIQTDIVLKAPELSFEVGGTISDTFAYSIVGNSGVAVESSAPISIKGSVYAGLGDTLEKTSLSLKGNVSFSNLKYLVSEGNADISMGTKMTVAPQSQFWAGNIVVDGNSETDVRLQGETYVADDLTLKGTSPKVTLGVSIAGSEVSGRYIGFGTNKIDPSKSSAIILNGTNSKLDMEHLKELLIGGYSYINTSKGPAVEKIQNQDVAMGESIAVKGNQVSYLIPPECIWVKNGTTTAKYNSNPITYHEYLEMYDELSAKDAKPDLGYTEVDGSIISTKLGKTLNDYLLPEQNINSIVRKVFVPYGGNGDGLVYYYINLSPEYAAKYSADYYHSVESANSSDKKRLEMYTDFYTDSIKVNGSSSLYTAGNYTLYDKDADSNMEFNTSVTESISNTLISYNDSFEAIVRTLEPKGSNLNSVTKANKAYGNLIDEDKLKDAVSTQNPKVITVGTGDDTLEAVLYNGNYEYDSSKSDHIALIICTGDVKVTKEFTGTIIAKGKIEIINCNVNSNNGERMKSLLAAPIPDMTDTAIYNIFKEGSSYVMGSGGGTGGSTMGIGNVPYSDIITYQNWQKKDSRK